jgi:putative phage-type endonuclease
MNIHSVIPQGETQEARDAHWHSLRSRVITSTDAPTLFGFNPYCSLRKLYRLKTEQVVDQRRVTPAMRQGLLFQDPVALKVAKFKNWQIRKKPEFMWLENEELGASFDWERTDGIVGPNEVKVLSCPMGVPKTWKVDRGELIEASLYIEIQVQTQMIVMNADQAYLSVRDGCGRYLWGIRRPNPIVRRQILDKTKRFMDSVRANRPPERGQKAVA